MIVSWGMQDDGREEGGGGGLTTVLQGDSIHRVTAVELPSLLYHLSIPRQAPNGDSQGPDTHDKNRTLLNL